MTKTTVPVEEEHHNFDTSSSTPEEVTQALGEKKTKHESENHVKNAALYIDFSVHTRLVIKFLSNAKLLSVLILYITDYLLCIAILHGILWRVQDE